MFKAIKDNKIIAINETGDFPCLVFDNVIEDTEHTIGDYEHYQGEFLLKSDIPAPTKEEISAIRQQLYVSDADPLKYDYEECLARYGEGSQKTVDAKNAWLAKKDEIRESNPYPVE